MTYRNIVENVEKNRSIERFTYLIPENQIRDFIPGELMTIKNYDDNCVYALRHKDNKVYEIKKEELKNFKSI